MKKSLVIFIVLVFAAQVFSQNNFSLAGSKVQLNGTSTLHDWSADVNKTSGSANMTLAGNELVSIKALTISMDAKSLKSSKGSTMDKNMNKTLKTDEYPKITFVLDKVKSITPKGNSYEVKADGKLTIAGTTKIISMTVNGLAKGNDFVFKGSQLVKMTDYNVEPPVMMLGTLKTANEVTINFEATFSNAGVSMN